MRSVLHRNVTHGRRKQMGTPMSLVFPYRSQSQWFKLQTNTVLCRLNSSSRPPIWPVEIAHLIRDWTTFVGCEYDLFFLFTMSKLVEINSNLRIAT